MAYLIHVANLLYLASYSVRDILWLRVLTVVAILALAPYFAANDLWEPIYWNMLFLVVNLVQLYRLILERRPVRMTAQQRRLHQSVFPMLRPRKFLQLLSIGQWQPEPQGEILVVADHPLDRLSLITDGCASVEVDGTPVTDLDAGQFVGEMSFVTGKPPSARVIAKDACRCVHWPIDELRKLLASSDELRASMQDVIGNDLAAKLRRGSLKRAPA